METRGISEPILEEPGGNLWVDRARGAVVCTAILGTAIIYSVHMESFLDVKAAVLGVCLIGVGLVLILRWRLPWEGVWAYGLLVAFFGVSTALHVFREDSKLYDFPYETYPQLLALMFAVVSFDLLKQAMWRRRVHSALVFSAVLVSLAAGVQVAGLAPEWFPTYGGKALPVYSVFGNSNLLGGYLAVVLPLIVWRLMSGLLEGNETTMNQSGVFSWAGHAASLVMVVAALGLSGSRGAWAAACAGCLVVLGTRGVTAKRAFALGVLAPIMLFAAVYAAPDRTLERLARTMSSEDSGGNLRIWFWDGTSRMIRDHWMVGTGLGAFAYHSPLYMGEALWAEGGERLAHNELLVEDPHCEPLLILAETGVVGALFWVMMAVVLLRRRGPEWGSLIALGVFACVSFPFRSPPHVFVALLLAGMLVARTNRQEPSPFRLLLLKPSRACSVSLGLVAIAMGTVYMACLAPGSYLSRYAQDIHLSGEPPFDAYERAIAWPFQRAGVHEKYGLALLQAGRNEEARRQYEKALRGSDTGAVHLALGLFAADRHDGQSAVAHWDAVVWRWPENETAWKGLLAGSDDTSRRLTRDRARRWLSEESVRRLESEAATQGATRGRSSP